MDRELITINFQDFEAANIENIEIFHDSVFEIIKSATINQSIDSIKTELKEMTYSYEKVYNRLKLDDSKNAACYYFGRVASLIDISLDILNEQKNTNIAKKVLKDYPLLLPVLQAISERGTISGTDLREKLALKTNSSLSNFIKRVYRYNLIEIDKVGHSNYYTLSALGQQLLNEYSLESYDTISKSEISFKQLLGFLNGVLEEIEEESPNTLNILHNYVKFDTSVSESKLLKQKLDSIFSNRDKFVCKKIQNSLKDTPKIEIEPSYIFYQKSNGYAYSLSTIENE